MMCGVASVRGPERCCLERKRQAAVRACSGEEARRGLLGEYLSLRGGLAHIASQRAGQVSVIANRARPTVASYGAPRSSNYGTDTFSAPSSCLIVPRVSNDRPGYWNTEPGAIKLAAAGRGARYSSSFFSRRARSSCDFFGQLRMKAQQRLAPHAGEQRERQSGK
jgi:hypothetical protein